jgi:phosphohistidine phosphatase SixA
MGVSLPPVATVPTSALKLRTTTLFLVRHADIPIGGADPNPHLTTNGGQARATELVHSLGRVAIGAVYVSDAFRTQETAAPLAGHLGLTPLVISAASAIVDHVKANFLGRTVFIAGHSNTVPEIITQFGGEQIQSIGPTEFDRLFVLSITELLKSDTQVGPVTVRIPRRAIATLHQLQYGQSN